MADKFLNKAQFDAGLAPSGYGIFSSVDDVTATLTGFAASSVITLTSSSDAAAVRSALATAIQVLEAIRKGKNV